MLARDKASDYLESSFREKLLEHVFISEVLQEVWLGRGETMEVLRSEVDAAGYDLLLDCGGTARYVQLKGSRADAKTSRQTVNVKLSDKPGGCIIWLQYEEEASARRMKLDYLFFGGGPGEQLPELGDKRGRHTRGDRTGHKGERSNTRVIPKKRFNRLSGAAELVDRLFGPGSRHQEIVG